MGIPVILKKKKNVFWIVSLDGMLLFGYWTHIPSLKQISSIITQILQNIKVLSRWRRQRQGRRQGYSNTWGFLQKTSELMKNHLMMEDYIKFEVNYLSLEKRYYKRSVFFKDHNTDNAYNTNDAMTMTILQCFLQKWVSTTLSLVPIQGIGTKDSVALTHAKQLTWRP